MAHKKVLVIENPCSGRSRQWKKDINLDALFLKHRYTPVVYTTTGKGSATEIARSHASEYDLIVCRGGDGTFSEMLNGLMQLETRPPIGYLPSGTTNELAVALDLPTNTEKAVDIILTNAPLSNDIGQFNRDRYFTYVASFGAFSECSYAASQKLKNKVGRFAYFYESAKEIKRIRPIPMRVNCDGVAQEGEFVIGSVSNSYSIGKVIKLDKTKVALNDGEFEVFLGKHPGSVSGWKDMLLSIYKKDFDERFIHITKAKQVSITVLDNTPIPWSLDGEFGGEHKTADIQVLNNAYRVISPKSPTSHAAEG